MASKARRAPPEKRQQSEPNMRFKQRMTRLAATLYQKADLAADHGRIEDAATLRARARGCEEVAR